MSDTNPELIVERDGSILILTMNRPQRRNAFSPEMLVRMSDAWVELSEDPELRVGIVTGADGHFSSGADLKAMAGMGSGSAEWAERVRTDADLAWRALLRHYRPTKPLIAAVEGYAIAGGTEILQAMDIRVAAETATFGIAEVRRGLFPLGGSTVRLRRQIPYTVAAELLLTGRFVLAREAKEIGLIGHVVPEGQALAKAKEIALQISENAPLAVQAVLKSLRETEGLSEIDGLKRELEIGQPIFATKDAAEGPRAFTEKRKPNFTGE